MTTTARNVTAEPSQRVVISTMYALLGGQLVVLLILDHLLVARWDASSDLGGYTQAWTSIAHGHLNPYSSIFARPFWRNHLELAMWPLSILYWLHHSPETLKWIQSVAEVGAEVVGLRWVLDALRRFDPSGIPVTPAVIGFVAIQVLNPELYGADWFDFHFEALSALFVLLAGRALYDGRTRAAVLWSLLTLTCGDVAGPYVATLGIAAVVCSRRTRAAGIILTSLGVGWVFLTGALGANLGSSLDAYRYLAAGGRAGTTALIGGLLAHPRTPLHVLRVRHTDLLNTVRGAGTIGIFSPWIFFLVVGAVVPPALSSILEYLVVPYQFVLATLAVPVGTVLTIDWVGRRRLPGARVAAYLLGAAVLASTLSWSTPKIRTAWSKWSVTSPSQVALLDQLRGRIPGRADLVVSENVIGGFASWAGVLAWGWGPTLAVTPRAGRPVGFVFVDDALSVLPGPSRRLPGPSSGPNFTPPCSPTGTAYRPISGLLAPRPFRSPCRDLDRPCPCSRLSALRALPTSRYDDQASQEAKTTAREA